MTGRGIDQVLPHPSDPRIHESYLKSALGYVEIAERANGPIPKPVGHSYVWGDALEVLQQVNPDLRIVNLETSITTSDHYWKRKGIHYRMHPKNIPCLTAARIDFCSLANNHILDWGYPGLTETLQALNRANVKSAGVGQNLQEAETPAILEVDGKGRVIVFAAGLQSSGISARWAALENKPGVNVLHDLSDHAVRRIQEMVGEAKQERDIIVVSLHWGDNWGYEIPPDQTEFAHTLIDEAGVDIVHGHSSHHVKGIEVYKEKLILYGCGDFLNDYEGISGHEGYRADLVLMYFASVDPSSGKLAGLKMTPMKIRRFQLADVSRADALWLRDVLNREGESLGTGVVLDSLNRLTLYWN